MDHHIDHSLAKHQNVWIRVSYVKILKVDTHNQKFEAEAIIEARWQDEEVKDLDYELSGLKWKPDLYIDNALSELRHEESMMVFEDSEGKVMVSQIRKVKGIFSENLELENFPLDIQNLTLQVTSKNSTNNVNFILDQPELNKQNVSNTLDKSMWHLHNMVKVSESKIRREYSFGKREYPCIEMTCQVFRKCEYYHWNALLPILLITVCSLSPFVLDSKATGSRLGTTASMLLSCVSYKIAVSRLLPTVSYLTSLDKYCIGSLVMIAGMLGYHAFFGLLTDHFDVYFLKYLDRLFFMAFTACILFQQLVYVRWLIRISDVHEKLIEKSIFYEQNRGTSSKKEN